MMSFWANYGQSSPYYQQPSVRQDRERAGNTYQANTYRPLSENQTQDTNSATSFYGDQEYGDINSAGSQSTYGARTGYANGRSLVDATPLGNLAYASSLGRAGASSHPSEAYRSASEYGTDTSAAISNRHSRVDSRGTIERSRADLNNSRVVPVTTPPPNSGYQPGSIVSLSYPSQTYSGNTGNNTPRQPHNVTVQTLQEPGLRFRPSLSSFQDAALSKEQTVRPRDSRTAPPSNQSPRLGPFQNPPLQRRAQQSREGQILPPSQQHYPPASSDLPGLYPPARSQQPPVGHQQSRQANTTDRPLQGGNSNSIGSVNSVLGQYSGGGNALYVQAYTSDQRSRQATPVEEHHPTTVDPSQVFNDYEYQKRKDEEIVKKEAAEIARVEQTTSQENNTPLGAASGDARSQSLFSQPGDTFLAARAAIGSSGETEAATKHQIELEMKQMIEKMRDYKAKDPRLFSQIWEQVKKGQVPQANSAKQSAQIASASTPVSTSPQASSIQSELPAESELPAASSFSPDLDRGRFPFQRRRQEAMRNPSVRGSRNHAHGARLSRPPDKIPLTTTAPLAPIAQMVSGESDQTDQRSYMAMQNFPQTLKTASPPPLTLHQKPLQPRFIDPNKTSPMQAKPYTVPLEGGKSKPLIGTTNWSEHNKRALVVAAMKYLTAKTHDVGKQITADGIRHLLDQNPSYIQVCEYLEGRGFVIDRGDFARLLLNAVSDEASPIQPQSEWNSTPLLPNGKRPENLQDAFNARYDPLRPQTNIQNQSGHTFERPVDAQSKSIPQLAYAGREVVDDQRLLSQWQTKENKARKRNFSDIIDLSQAVSGDEDFEHHHPKSKMDIPSDSRSFNPTKKVNNGTGSSVPSSSQAKRKVDSWLRLTILKARVVDQMNKRRDARRCSTYDPKTIARDILISSGKHPTMRPLNYHLEILRDRFEYVNNDSDLSTLRWDIIDPAEKSSERQNVPATMADIMDENAGGGVGNKKSANVPPSRSDKGQTSKQLGRPRKHPGQEVISADRHGKSHLNPGIIKTPTAAQNTAYEGILDVIKSQVQNPQAETDVVNRQRRSGLTNSFAYTPVATSKASLNAAGSNSLASSLPLKVVPSVRTDLLTSPVPPPLSNLPSQKKVVHRKIGRPPGAKDKQPRVRTSVPNSSNSTLSLTAKPMRPPPPLGSTPRKSSGLVNAISPTDGIAVVIQSRSPSVAGSRSQQNNRVEVKVEDATQAYKSYKCGWEQCPAELHNLETLRKHVRKHRQGLDRHIPCKWAECGNITPGTAAREWQTYRNEAAWDRHVEKNHIRDVAKAQGDVLSGDSAGELDDRYLEDELSLQ